MDNFFFFFFWGGGGVISIHFEYFLKFNIQKWNILRVAKISNIFGGMPGIPDFFGGMVNSRCWIQEYVAIDIISRQHVSESAKNPNTLFRLLHGVSLFAVAPVVCKGFVLGLCFVLQSLCPF